MERLAYESHIELGGCGGNRLEIPARTSARLVGSENPS